MRFSLGCSLVGAACAGFLVAVLQQAWLLAGFWALGVLLAIVVGIWLDSHSDPPDR